jgi:hypothetical protein
MAKLSRPPKKKIDDFLEEPERGFAEKPETAEPKNEDPKEPEKLKSIETSFPWEQKSEKIMKGVNLRLTEVQHEKLKFVYEYSTEKSLQKLIMSVLEPFIEERIEELKRKETI